MLLAVLCTDLICINQHSEHCVNHTASLQSIRRARQTALADSFRLRKQACTIGTIETAVQQSLQSPKNLLQGRECCRLRKQQTAAESLEPLVTPRLLQAAQA